MKREEITMQESQLVAADVMEQIHRICKQLDLQYFLAYGTLLGAIRHKGYIPWDDDLDIMMPRKDYDKLLEYFQTHEQELMPYQLFTNRNNPDYPYMIARVCDCRYEIETDNEKDCGMGAFVDIYPMDGLGRTQKEALALMRRTNKMCSLCFLSTRLRCEKGNTKSKLRLLIKFPAFVFAKLVGKRRFMNKLEDIAKTCDYDSSEYIGCVVWDTEGIRGIFPKKWFLETMETEFDGHQFKIPKEYDAVLRKTYGEYMQLPPEQDRIAHHFYRIYKK